MTPGNFYETGGFRIREGKEKFYSGKFPSEYLLKKNDLVIAMTEQGPGLLGSPGLIPASDVFLHNQRIGLVQIKNLKLIDKIYLYYLFFTKEVRNEIFGSATGTKVKHTAPKRIYSIRIQLPPLPTQRRIASILSAYDDLIENNLRRIKLLEELAQRTHEEWFVRYRFPGHETAIFDAETGLPEGWEKGQIGNVCITSGGGTPSRLVEEYWAEGEFNWFSPTDLTKASSIFLNQSSQKISALGLQKSSAKLLDPISFMMSSRATIGLFAITDKPFCTNQGFINITPTEVFHREYLIYNFKSRVEEFKGHASGATFHELSKSKFKVLDILWPDETSLRAFSEFVKELHTQIAVLTNQNSRLKETRDILLPKIMSGQLVPEGRAE